MCDVMSVSQALSRLETPAPVSGPHSNVNNLSWLGNERKVYDVLRDEMTLSPREEQMAISAPVLSSSQPVTECALEAGHD